jgi:hypothetical protein
LAKQQGGNEFVYFAGSSSGNRQSERLRVVPAHSSWLVLSFPGRFSVPQKRVFGIEFQGTRSAFGLVSRGLDSNTSPSPDHAAGA